MTTIWLVTGIYQIAIFIGWLCFIYLFFKSLSAGLHIYSNEKFEFIDRAKIGLGSEAWIWALSFFSVCNFGQDLDYYGVDLSRFEFGAFIGSSEKSVLIHAVFSALIYYANFRPPHDTAE